MRRCCFDLEVLQVDLGIVNGVYTSKWEFFCAVVYDEALDSFHEFFDAGETCRFMVGSDALITFNGLGWDMDVLEKSVGAAGMAPLRATAHLDVWKITCPHTGLSGTVDLYAPEIKPRLDAYRIECWERGGPGWVVPEKWKTTKARLDVEYTYACLKAIENDLDLPTRIHNGCYGDSAERLRESYAADATAKSKSDRCPHCRRYFD
jgi:hypothetical protein